MYREDSAVLLERLATGGITYHVSTIIGSGIKGMHIKNLLRPELESIPKETY